MEQNPLFTLNNRNGIGIYSVCTANGVEIEVALEFAKDKN